MTNRIFNALGMFAMALIFANLFAVIGAAAFQAGQILTACMCGVLALGTVATGAVLSVDIVRN